MSPNLQTLIAVGVAFVGGAVCMAISQRGECDDCAKQTRELRNLKASNESLQHQVGVWINRAFALGYSPDLTNAPDAKIRQLLGDIYSTERDTERLRIWRERRALLSIDHTQRHSFGGEDDGEIAENVVAMWLPEEGE
jgi:hypothetical protein